MSPVCISFSCASRKPSFKGMHSTKNKALPVVRAISILFLCLIVQVAASAQPLHENACGDPLLRIAGFNEADFTHACEAFSRVKVYLLDEHKLRLREPVLIIFADRATADFGQHSYRVLGVNDREARQIRMTSFSSAWLHDKERLIYNMPISKEMHVSLLVHELTHSILADNYQTNSRGFASEEYLAYSVQFATMNVTLRDEILLLNPVEPFATTDDITDLYLMFNPHEFALRAYLHFAREGAARMLSQVLFGEFVTFLP
jgi:hypothetical protein